jgi:hypothetical protein
MVTDITAGTFSAWCLEPLGEVGGTGRKLELEQEIAIQVVTAFPSNGALLCFAFAVLR